MLRDDGQIGIFIGIELRITSPLLRNIFFGIDGLDRAFRNAGTTVDTDFEPGFTDPMTAETTGISLSS